MTIWRPSINFDQSARPYYLAISQAIESDVLAGRLKPGDRLPPHRELAGRLQVTVATVSRAYAEARKAGWISGEIGRGTFVLDRKAGRFPKPQEADEDVIDLGLNLPCESPAPDLASALRALAAKEDVQSLLRYNSADPVNDLLAGAAVLRRHGLNVNPEQIVMCAGAQHGLSVALEAATRAGDCVIAEELTYPAFRPLAESRSLRIHPVALDEEGINPAALNTACRKTRAKALYLVPTLHNPTAHTLSAERRKALVEVARRHDLIIIEDDVYRMLQPEAPPPIAQIAPERTIYVTSLSKSFVPGLRLGYVVGPPSLHSRLVGAVDNSIWMLPPITAALATHWVLQGEYDSIVSGKRREAAARQSLAARILPADRLRTANTSYHLWLKTNGNAESFTLRAREHGVVVIPGSAFYLGSGRPPEAVRVSLSAAHDRSVLVTALERLRSLIEGTALKLYPRL
ncbi:MAG TPA: PLP-dependent aminotransferase family protein [Pyrinomonadaceae bacterium]|nr:PLP-dependent aminotransferase family protein [Pyrinomonadaceae bacterium]